MTRTLLLMALCLTTHCALAQRIVIYLDNAPTSTPSVSKAPLRYDKEFAYSLTFDDGSADAYVSGLPALQGGFVAGNGTTYSALNFTDGCGNTLPFRAGVAWNAASSLGIDNHTGNVPGMMTWSQLDELYDKGWDVLNHSFTHKARWLGAMTATDYANEINQNLPATRDKTRNRIEMPAFVVPSGDTYYHDIAYAQGQKIVFDQSPNTVGIGGLSVGTSIPQVGQVVHRTEVDNQINTGGNIVGTVANRAALGERIWYNEFTHRISNFGSSAGLPFVSFRTHVEKIATRWGKNGTDKMWMAPLQEVLEYLTTREKATFTASLNGNQLTIDFNLQNVPTWLRRRPLTLVLNSGGTFSRVEVSQGVQMTFNGTGTKKIINLDFANASTVINPCDNDLTPPVLSNCPQNISLTTSGTTALATWTPPTATDNCSTPSVTSNFTSGATFPIGSTTVTYTAIDAKTNRSTCNFNIVVAQTVVNPCDNDLTPPIISNCPQNINLTTTGINAIATWTAPTATDNCSTPSVTSNFTSGSTFPIGSTTVTYTARDAKTNRSTCNFNVVVAQTVVNPCDNDLTPPVISNCPQNINLTTTGINVIATWTVPTVTDNCSPPSVSSNYASGATFSLGSTTVTYTATDAKNNRSTCNFNIVVTQPVINPCDNDVTPPVISNCPQNINLTTTGINAIATWTAPTATDNCSTPSVTSNFPSGSTFPIGSTTVTYTAKDIKSNRSTCSFNVVVSQTGGSACANDVTPPVFQNCGQSINVTTATYSASVVWTPPNVSDDCSSNPDLTSNYENGSVFPLGATTIIYVATDDKLNRSTCSFTVNVTRVVTTTCTNDATPPLLKNCPPNITLSTTSTVAYAAWIAPTATDNCTANPTISSNFPSGVNLPLGVTTVSYTAADAKGNQSTCSFTVNVQPIVIGEICTSKSEFPWQEWISKVQFNTLLNISEKTRFERYLVGYSDFRDLSTTVTTNQTYTLNVTATESYSSGNTNLYYRAWIDFNNNGYFESNENVLEKNNNGRRVASENVYIPDNAKSGTVRMRVSMKKGSYPAPCENFSNGEVEDYSIVIAAPIAPIVNLTRYRPTQLVPIVIHKIAPNPTDGDVFVKLESLDKRTVTFEFYNTMGMLVKSEKQEVEKGTNTVGFDFSKAPQGVYFIQTNVGQGREVPVKFIKM